MRTTAWRTLPGLLLAGLAAAACSRARELSFEAPHVHPDRTVRDSIDVRLGGLECGAEEAFTLPFAARHVAAAASTFTGGRACGGAMVSVQSVAGDSAVLRVVARVGGTEVDEPVVARRGPPREHALAAGVRVTAAVREAPPRP